MARELLRVSEDNRVQVLELAHEKTKGKVTAEDIASAKEKIEPPKKKKEKTAPKKAVVKPDAALKAAEKLLSFLAQEPLPAVDGHQKAKLMLHLNSILEHAENKQLLLLEASAL